jgi:hypothetical protein
VVSKIQVYRETSGCNGTLEYTHNKIETTIAIRTGSPLQKYKSEWVTAKSGIPIGKFWLWNKKAHVQQYNDLDATGNEIGRFYPISSMPAYPDTIWNHNHTKKREYIGLHDENSIKGSAGCVVVINNLEFRELCKCLEDTPEGLIPFLVNWGV